MLVVEGRFAVLVAFRFLPHRRPLLWLSASLDHVDGGRAGGGDVGDGCCICNVGDGSVYYDRGISDGKGILYDD